MPPDVRKTGQSRPGPGHAPSPAYLRVGTRYRANRLDPRYDAIVIGSGPGGLSAAVCLAKMGFKVAVLEQHYTAGGFTHAYGRQGYEWDVGVHYIGDMGLKTTRARQLFDFLSDHKLLWASMGAHYDRVVIGDYGFNFPSGQRALLKALLKDFPNEHKALQQYFKLLRKVSRSMSLYGLSKLLPHALSEQLTKRLPPLMFETTRSVLEKLTSNQQLIAVLTTQWGDAGITPRDSSFLIHAIIARHYLHGGYYPIGGASMIARTQLPAIQAEGGNVFTYARVTEILAEQGKVQGVKMADGHVIQAPVVISGAGVFNTLGKLLPLHPGFNGDALLTQVDRSMSHIGMYLGFKLSNQALNLPKTNLWVYSDINQDRAMDAFNADIHADFPLIYISFPSAKDPSWNDRYPNRATVEIVAPAHHQWFDAWQDTHWAHRGDDYEAFKQSLADRLLRVLYQQVPQLEGNLDYWELSTPLSTRHFNGYEKGEIYGLQHDPNRFQQQWLRPKTAIKGLYLTGQDTLTCGVVGAAMSGVLTAVSVLGWRKGLILWRRITNTNR